MSKQKPFGKCALCGKECELTFEHIPPRAALNKNASKLYSGEVIITRNDLLPWELDGLHYTNSQRGIGMHTLCPNCNNLTGTWYGEAYADMVKNAIGAFELCQKEEANGIGMKDVYVARFLKQVVSMFCSVNNQKALSSYSNLNNHSTDGCGHPTIQNMINAQLALSKSISLFDELRKYALDKNAVCLDSNKFKICMYFTKGIIGKLNAVSAAIDLNNNTFELLSEIVVYPFGFILYLNPSPDLAYKGIDITRFSNYHYDQKATIELPLAILDNNSVLPNDNRTKQEIINTINENKKWKKEYETDDDV